MSESNKNGITSAQFDQIFDEGDDIFEYLELSQARLNKAEKECIISDVAAQRTKGTR